MSLLFINVCKNLSKKALYLSVNVFSTKVLTGDTIFHVSYWRWDRRFTWSSEPHESLPFCRAKGVRSFLSCFKTLSIGPVPGIEPVTSRSAVKRSTDLANPIPRQIIFYIQAPCEQGNFLSSWSSRRTGGSVWIASNLWNRCKANFWTRQSCFLSSNCFFRLRPFVYW